jgi:DNA-directed RNA polymerase specialized sigma24 family protein
MTSTEVTAQYDEHVDLIRKTVWEFITRLGLSYREFDELFSQANLYFMLACKSYEPERAEFSTWVRTQVWTRLMNEWRNSKLALEKLYLPRERTAPSYAHIQTPILDIVDELGVEGLTLLILVRSGKLDLSKIFADHPNSLRAVFRTIVRFLYENGWSSLEIRQSIRDLGKLYRGQ